MSAASVYVVRMGRRRRRGLYLTITDRRAGRVIDLSPRQWHAWRTSRRSSALTAACAYCGRVVRLVPRRAVRR